MRSMLASERSRSRFRVLIKFLTADEFFPLPIAGAELRSDRESPDDAAWKMDWMLLIQPSVMHATCSAFLTSDGISGACHVLISPALILCDPRRVTRREASNGQLLAFRSRVPKNTLDSSTMYVYHLVSSRIVRTHDHHVHVDGRSRVVI